MIRGGAHLGMSPTVTEEAPTIDSQLAMKQDFKSNSISSQTLSPEGSIVSPVSSQDSLEDKKRRYSDIQEETDSIKALTTPKRQTQPNSEREETPESKLEETTTTTDTTITNRASGENDLNVIDKEANDILRQINQSISEAELSLRSNSMDDDSRKMTTTLLESLKKAKALILKLNLDKNLFKFQITSELEQNNIEKQILLRNLDTFQTNLNSLMIDNNNLNDKNMKLIKYYKYLKYGKLKDLKLKNAKLTQELDSLKGNYNNHQQNNNINTQSSSSSSGRSSIAYAQQQQQTGENRMLNTLGMLASQVLANEEPPQGNGLPPTFGSITSSKNQLGGSSEEDNEEED